MNQEYCCKSLQNLIENVECPIEYLAYRRGYVMVVPKHYLKRNDASMNYKIQHCPCCGVEFPKSLSTEWWDIIGEKFGITDVSDSKKNKLPKEFKTDQWWKKRGL